MVFEEIKQIIFFSSLRNTKITVYVLSLRNTIWPGCFWCNNAFFIAFNLGWNPTLLFKRQIKFLPVAVRTDFKTKAEKQIHLRSPLSKLSQIILFSTTVSFVFCQSMSSHSETSLPSILAKSHLLTINFTKKFELKLKKK